MSDTKTILKTKDLSINFGGLVALDTINLDVSVGEIYGLLGPNGAGKPTLFNLIAGRYLPSNGRVYLNGTDITKHPPHQRVRRGIARTFQIPQPFHELTVEENVMVGAITRFSTLPEMREAVAHLVDQVGLSHKRNELAKRLSTGQRKRLELARALATEPRLLLLDEVTGGVDQPSIPGLIDLIAGLREKNFTILLIEHNTTVMMELSDRMMFLNRGKKLIEGLPNDVANHPEVINLYLGKGGEHA